MATKEEEEEIKKDTLWAAINNDDIQTVQNIITSIKDINDGEYFFLYQTCLTRNTRNTELVQLFLDHGAKHDIEDDNGGIPLHRACWYDRYEIVEMLLKRGSIDLIDKQNIDGWTPLNIGCRNGNKKVVAVLLRYGASLTIQNAFRKTPLEVARKYGYYDIVEMINKEEERRRNVGNVGCHLLRASRGLCGFDDIPPEIQRVVLSFFDEDRVLTEKQVKHVIDFGFGFTSLSNNSVLDKRQFISQMKLDF